MLREVRAGVPRRRPPGRRALLSPGHVFLFTAMETSSRTFSALAPSVFIGRRSTNTKWLSVPPARREDMKTWKKCKEFCQAVPAEVQELESNMWVQSGMSLLPLLMKSKLAYAKCISHATLLSNLVESTFYAAQELTWNKGVSIPLQSLGHRLAIAHHLKLVIFEVRPQGQTQSNANSCKRNKNATHATRAYAEAVGGLPAMAWLWGPPCSPGNTASLIFLSSSYMTLSPFGVTLRRPAKQRVVNYIISQEQMTLQHNEINHLCDRRSCQIVAHGESCGWLW